MEKERAAEATKTIDAEWKELQMLVSALKVRRCLAYCGFLFNTSSLLIMYFILCVQLSSNMTLVYQYYELPLHSTISAGLTHIIN